MDLGRRADKFRQGWLSTLKTVSLLLSLERYEQHLIDEAEQFREKLRIKHIILLVLCGIHGRFETKKALYEALNDIEAALPEASSMNTPPNHRRVRSSSDEKAHRALFETAMGELENERCINSWKEKRYYPANSRARVYDERNVWIYEATESGERVFEQIRSILPTPYLELFQLLSGSSKGLLAFMDFRHGTTIRRLVSRISENSQVGVRDICVPSRDMICPDDPVPSATETISLMSK